MAILSVRRHTPHSFNVLVALLLIMTIGTMPEAAPPSDYDEEIRDLKEKIERVRKKSADVKAEIGRDLRSFGSADSLQQGTVRRLTDEKASLAEQYERAGVRLDSLQLEMEDIGRRCNNLAIGGKQFSGGLLDACDRLLAALDRLPPVNIGNHSGALRFLKSEIKGKSVDNTEALERFWQILFAVNDMAGSVDVHTAPSPVPSVAGEMFFIRIGLAWLGVVEDKGAAAFIWHADTVDTAGAWMPVEQPSDVAAMLKCARMHQGNAVPEITGLPFDEALAVEGADEGGERK